MTLTPEMVDKARVDFEKCVLGWPFYKDGMLKKDGRYPDYYGNPVVQGAWEGFKAGRAQSQPKYSPEPIMPLAKVADDIDAMCTCRHCDEWVASIRHHMSQRAVGVEAKLDAPAKVGAVIFREGVSWSSVIACAKRAYAHKDDPNPSAEDVEKLRALIERAGGGVCAR